MKVFHSVKIQIAALLALAAIVAAPASGAAERQSNRRTPVVAAIEKVSPAVVNISTEQIVRETFDPFHDFGNDFFKQFDDFFNQFDSPFTRDYKRQTLGSGVIIDKTGHILTNSHVIMQASKITVTLPDHREFEGRVIGADPNIDLAIIKIDVKGGLPTVDMGDSDDIMIGETVITVGNPFGLEHTVTTGVLSARNRSIKAGDGKVYNNFLQTDASINPGNSGGPLVNLDGEVIGINTAIYAEGQGIGFAIPINRAKRAIDELIKFGEIKRAWFGARVQTLTQDLGETFNYFGTYGVLVSDILPDSPAEKSGLLRGDIILEIDNTVLHSTSEFHDRLAGAMIGEKLKLKIFRNGKEDSLTMTAGNPPVEDATEIAAQWLGIEVTPLDKDTAARMRITPSDGVLVSTVKNKSLAFNTGLRAGDVLRQLGETTIKDADSFKLAVVLASERPTAVIVVQRGTRLYHTVIGTE